MSKTPTPHDGLFKHLITNPQTAEPIAKLRAFP